MLVLSRRENQSIRFPNLGISVQVVRVAGKKVRIGIHAPKDVRILRDELCDPAQSLADVSLRELRHRRRNEWNKVRIGLALAQKQLECGQAEEAEQTLTNAMSELGRLDQAASHESLLPECCSQQMTSQTAASHKRALIVEDNDNERELLAGYLRLSGFKVDTVSNGLEAIKYLSEAGGNLPHAVVLDMKMPKLDGAKTVTNIRFRPTTKNLRLYAVSGSTPDEMALSVGPNGVDRWFSKPINPEELVRHISAEHDELAPGYVWPLGVVFDPSRAGKPELSESVMA